MRVRLAVLVFISAGCLFLSLQSLAQTQSLTTLTTNNTAACSAPNYGLLPPIAYCADAFPASNWPFTANGLTGWGDGLNGVLTPVYDPSVAATGIGNSQWNISKPTARTVSNEVPATSG